MHIPKNFRYIASTLLVTFALSYSVSTQAAPAVPQCSTEISGLTVDQGKDNSYTAIQATAAQNYFVKPGECIVSPNRKFAAVMQSDGEFVVYPTDTPVAEKHVWAASTFRRGLAGLLVKQDGNIAIYSAGGITVDEKGRPSGNGGKVEFSSNSGTKPYADYFLAMQDHGNIVLYKGKAPTISACIWSSNTGAPCNKPNPSGKKPCRWVVENTQDGQRQYWQCPN